MSRNQRRLLEGILAFMVALWFGAPHWPSQYDDLFISLAYAHEWAINGSPAWSSGDLVEGYSNFALVALSTWAVRLGIDASAFAQAVALGAGVILFLVFERLLARDRDRLLVLLALAAWAPFSYWSVQGMETQLYTLTLVTGWLLVTLPWRTQNGRWAHHHWAWGLGTTILAMSAMTRPEGHLHWGAAILLRMFAQPLRREDGLAIFGAAILAAWHVWRVSTYGAWLPLPVVVKGSVAISLSGAIQASSDLLLGIGVLAGTLAIRQPNLRSTTIAAIPLLIQLAVLIKADGDWFQWSRLSYPGMVAGTAIALALMPVARRGRWAALGTLGFIGTTSFFVAREGPLPGGQVGWRDRLAPSEVVDRLRRGLHTPIFGDVEWVVTSAPPNAIVLASDVGMLGNVHDIKIQDAMGLVDADVAYYRTSRSPEAAATMMARYADPKRRPDCIRVVHWAGGQLPHTLDGDLATYTLSGDYGYGSGVMRWFCEDAEQQPTSDLVISRWERLSSRYPSQPWLVWHLALARTAAGDMAGGQSLADNAKVRFPSYDPLRHTPASLAFTHGTQPLKFTKGAFQMLRNGSITSRPLVAGEFQQGLALNVTPVAPGKEVYCLS